MANSSVAGLVGWGTLGWDQFPWGGFLYTDVDPSTPPNWVDSDPSSSTTWVLRTTTTTVWS